MQGPSCGIVIGHYNQPDFLELNIAAIRHHCGDVPILVSDDCSDGFGQTPRSNTLFGRVLLLAEKDRNVTVWPNVSTIGHAGGDMSAFWKGLIWSRNLGFDVLFKISQRLIFDIPDWVRKSAKELINSGAKTLGKGCTQDPWQLRTESVAMLVRPWSKPSILTHLTPRPINVATELVLYDDVRDRLDDSITKWSLMADSRYERKEGVLFRATHSPSDYFNLANRLGLYIQGPLTCEASENLQNYKIG